MVSETVFSWCSLASLALYSLLANKNAKVEPKVCLDLSCNIISEKLSKTTLDLCNFNWILHPKNWQEFVENQLGFILPTYHALSYPQLTSDINSESLDTKERNLVCTLSWLFWWDLGGVHQLVHNKTMIRKCELWSKSNKAHTLYCNMHCWILPIHSERKKNLLRLQ